MTDSAAATDADENTTRRASRPKRKPSAVRFLRDIVLIVIAALVISFLIKTFLIRSFYIPSQSMEDTLLINDRIIVNELAPDLMPLKHGDIVVFKDPGGWLTGEQTVPQPTGVAGALANVLNFVGLSASASDDDLIKRVIGLPGDTVACCDDFGRLQVNGVSIDEPYVRKSQGQPNGLRPFDVTVPAGKLWVMGDNRYQSADSSYHYLRIQPGDQAPPFVPIDDVVGRAVVISWPISRWEWLSDYPQVFAGVEEKRSR